MAAGGPSIRSEPANQTGRTACCGVCAPRDLDGRAEGSRRPSPMISPTSVHGSSHLRAI